MQARMLAVWPPLERTPTCMRLLRPQTQPVLMSPFLSVAPPSVEAQCERAAARPAEPVWVRGCGRQPGARQNARPWASRAQQPAVAPSLAKRTARRPLITAPAAKTRPRAADWARFRAFDLVNCIIPILCFGKVVSPRQAAPRARRITAAILAAAPHRAAAAAPPPPAAPPRAPWPRTRPRTPQPRAPAPTPSPRPAPRRRPRRSQPGSRRPS